MGQENTLQEVEIKSFNWKTRIILIGIAALSFFLFAALASNPDNYHASLQELTDKQHTVMKMTGITAAASAGITLIPDDVGTPIAEKLADLSGYLVFVYCVILFEKYLMTLGGWVAFKLLIPAGLVIFALFRQQEKARKLCVKLFVFAFVIWAIVPLSTKVTQIIEATHEEIISTNINELENSISDGKADTEVSDNSNETEENQSIFNRWNKTSEEDTEEIKESEESDENIGIFKSWKKSKEKAIEKFKNVLSNMVETIAVMIVTCCIIPLAVLLFLIWIVRLLFGIVINIPIPKGSKVVKKFNEWKADREE